jgi:hypothetical protein
MADEARRPPVAHLRAILLGIVLLAHTVRAIPFPIALTEKELKEEWRQNDIEMWRGWLANAGIDLSHEWIEQWLMKWTGVSGKVRKTLRAPFDPLFDTLAIDQAWALFASATTRPDRLVIEARRDGQWTVLFRRLDPCCTWRDPQLRYRRIRGIWDGQKDSARPAYRGFSQWVADRVFEEFPEVDAVRVELEKTHSVYPWVEPDPSVEVRLQRTHRRMPP